MAKGRFIIIALLLVVTALFSGGRVGLESTARAQGQALPTVGASLAAQGRNRFTEHKYDEAIDLLRKHLRRTPKDYNSWNVLAAAYYYTGQPRKALRFLKHVERYTTEKSYNYYYQGLCYEAISPAALDISTGSELGKAKEFLTFAAQNYNDEYAARATYEVGVLEYNTKNKIRASYWLTLYLQRYPHGVYGVPAERLLQSMRDGVWYSHVEGTKKPDMEEALFKYNKLSLSNTPNYWFVQTGFQFIMDSEPEPQSGGSISLPQTTNDYGLLTNAGVGIGPLTEDNVTVFGGYTYRQIWHSDDTRISEWAATPTDFNYFLFRADQLERHHQLYGDIRANISNLFYLGLYGRYELARIGSQYLPSSNISELRHTIKIADTQLLIPWVGFSYFDYYRSMFYFYMRKEINYDTADYSNKTYDFGLAGGQPTISLGLSQIADYPQYDLVMDLELFRYQFIYNDPWLDYQRQGFFFSSDYEFISHFYVDTILGYYQDTYIKPRLKTTACATGSSGESSAGGLSPTATLPPAICSRVDTGYLLQLGLYWNYSQFQRLAIYGQYVKNQNNQQQEFNEDKYTVQLMYTLAFPSVKRVSRYIDRFADTAFTKILQ